MRPLTQDRPITRFRPFPLDGALLLFDRASGTHVLLDGEETAHYRQRAPRAVQFGITNRCNLACSFCSRDVDAASSWTADAAFEFLAELGAAGVLEVAFGGGEPWTFPGFAALVARLHDETELAVHATTNGLALDPRRLDAVRDKIGEVRLSLYDDNDWRARVVLLSESGVRFGVNYLVTPARLPTLEAVVLELVHLGCRDVLLLSYNGDDRALHLSKAAAEDLAARVLALHAALVRRCVVKLDVCWGERLEAVPRLLDRAGDCGAGRDFLVITSDRRLMPCSFHHVSIPITGAADALRVWRERRELLSSASNLPGCARVAGYGLEEAS